MSEQVRVVEVKPRNEKSQISSVLVTEDIRNPVLVRVSPKLSLPLPPNSSQFYAQKIGREILGFFSCLNENKIPHAYDLMELFSSNDFSIKRRHISELAKHRCAHFGKLEML